MFMMALTREIGRALQLNSTAASNACRYQDIVAP
jgi:hypothetical protein